MKIIAIEFFSGLGGWRFAMKGRGVVVAAYDICNAANTVYEHNFGELPQVREIASIPASEIRSLNADTWLMSPPCQPYCRMGKGLDVNDKRAAALLRLIDLIPEAAPDRIILENVQGFLESLAYGLLAKRLGASGYKWGHFTLCPTQFGFPNRRARVFVAASRTGSRSEAPPEAEPRRIGEFLDAIEDPGLYLPDEIIERFGPGLDIVTAESRRSACFIGGYGKRYTGSGSFLKTPKGLRRFSPMEIGRLLGYPPEFSFPLGISLNKQYRLLGNSLNLAVAEWVLKQAMPSDNCNQST